MKKDFLKINDIKLLPAPGKVAATHALDEMGFSVRKIAEIIEVDPSTIVRYKKQEIKEEYVQFANMVKEICQEQDFELRTLVYKHLKAKMPKAQFSELMEFFDKINDRLSGQKKQDNSPFGNPVQINNVINQKGKEYGLD